MKRLITIADWVNDSLPCQEIRSAVRGYAKNSKDVNISFVSSTPSTIHTGFLLGQIVETEERLGVPLETVIFVNTDPRIQAQEELAESKGADLVIIRLISGLYIFGPNAGYCFSFIKNKIEKIFVYKNLDRGSQFRSRDLYARIGAHLMDEMEDELELEETHTNMIQALDSHYVGHIDNFGNIKTTIPVSLLKRKYEFGKEVEVHINGVSKKAKFVNNLFGGGKDILVIYPGSSGVKSDPYLEISIWRHFTEKNPTTGLHEFNYPRPGMEIKI